MAKNTRKPKATTKLENPEFAKAVGTTTFLRLDWQSWDKLPPQNQQIFVIIRLDNGYYPVTATYLDEFFEAKGPFTASRWQQVKFDDSIPMIFLGSKDAKRLIAWARLIKVDKKVLTS